MNNYVGYEEDGSNGKCRVRVEWVGGGESAVAVDADKHGAGAAADGHRGVQAVVGLHVAGAGGVLFVADDPAGVPEVRPGHAGGAEAVQEVFAAGAEAVRRVRHPDEFEGVPCELLEGVPGAVQGGAAELPDRDPGLRAGGLPLFIRERLEVQRLARYVFSSEVLGAGSKLLKKFYKMQQMLRSSYSKICQEDENFCL